MKRAYYSSSISEFCNQEAEQILGQMTQQHSFDLTLLQRDAWVEQTYLLKNVLSNYDGKIYFEFSIPRMGRRVDAVIIIESVIFVIEFKVGSKSYESADLDQVMDYALDMKNFHEGSHYVTLVPILVATKAPIIDFHVDTQPEDRLFSPVCCNADSLGDVIKQVLDLQRHEPVERRAGRDLAGHGGPHARRGHP